MKPILDSPLVIVAWPVRLALDVSTSLGADVFTFLDIWHDPAR